ncbi:uncharacterized protein LOC131244184 [Magnolia sinica]|uniref:uncharacterized protein LOC131244184 n=1 Tax=Magnolia sinica TaxID=86752 RepID=UPI002659E78C|nr:uncharacterized protein LOC131244184 [Magnolia sinica]
MEEFDEITFSHMPRVKNQFADALATLASMLEIPKGVAKWELTVELQEEPTFCLQIDEAEPPLNDQPWYTDIKEYLEHQKYPKGATLTDRRIIQRLAAQFVITEGILYKRSFNQVLLRCVDETETAQIMSEIHEGLCSPHMNRHMMAKKILRLYYYWLTMETDCYKHVRRYFKCQEHANQIHAPTSELYNLTAPWPFSVWGLDIIGKINPKASNGHEYILVAVDYFTKRIEAISYTTIAASHFKIQCHRSSPYRPQMNSGVEAANKTIIRILEKMVKTYRDWSEMLPYALWAYRTSVRSAIGATPYELTYRMEAVLSVEIKITSLRVLLESEVKKGEWQQARYDQLHLADEKCMRALSHSQCYQRRIARAYNKRVRKRSFKVGDMIMKRILPPHLPDSRGKFKPSWDGPLIIREVLPGGALRLTNLRGEDLSEPINADHVKIYHR